MKDSKKLEVIQTINDLYISYRRKMLYQYRTKFGDVKYTTLPRGGEDNERKYYLTDGWLVRHLSGEKTVGVYSGSAKTKFICFDVDTEDTAEEDTRHLVNVIEGMNILREDIHVSLSGSKGYHVELFFDDLIFINSAEIFYRRVLEESGFNVSQVELRPLTKQGVKLPLGKHQKTGKRCWYIDNRTFNEIESFDYILGIVPLNAEEFISEQCEEYKEDYKMKYRISKKESKKVGEVVNTLDLSSSAKEGIKSELKKILVQGHLNFPERNKYTVFLSMYLRDMGNDALYTEEQIVRVMLNTKRNFPEMIDSSESEIILKTAKAVKQTYKKGYTLHERELNVKVYKEEVDKLLKLESIPLKKLYLSMLVHGKTINGGEGTFYMTYSTMAGMGNIDRASTLKEYVNELSDRGYIEIVSRGVKAKEGYRYGGVSGIYQPNVYRVIGGKSEEGNEVKGEDYIEIKGGTNSEKVEVTLVRALGTFYELKELRKPLTRDQYNKVRKYIKEREELKEGSKE